MRFGGSVVHQTSFLGVFLCNHTCHLPIISCTGPEPPAIALLQIRYVGQSVLQDIFPPVPALRTFIHLMRLILWWQRLPPAQPLPDLEVLPSSLSIQSDMIQGTMFGWKD